MLLSDLTDEEGEQFAAHVALRERACLIDLAHIVHGTGGPLDSLDGSAAGVEAFYLWFVEWRRGGSVGLDLTVPASLAVALGHTSPIVPAIDGMLSAQLLEHAYMLAIQAHDPNARWIAYRDDQYPDSDRNELSIAWGDGRAFWSSQRCLMHVANIDAGGTAAFQPDVMSHVLRVSGLDIDQTTRSVSLLRPYLRFARVSADDPSRVPPRFPPRETLQFAQKQDADLLPVEALVYADAMADLAEGPYTRALDEGPIFDLLANFDLMRYTGEPADVGDLRVGGQLQLLGGTVLAWVVADAGRLRSIQIDPGRPKISDWMRLVSDLRDLADSTGARLAPEDMFEAE